MTPVSPRTVKILRCTFVALAAQWLCLHVYAVPGFPGTLDATFGMSSQVAGTVVTPVKADSNDSGRALAVQPDGKIVVGGRLG